MASVFLRFTPPDRKDLAALLIYEEVSAEGPFDTLIETAIEIGVYPDYISEYTTDQAVSNVNWFAIQWQDVKGARTEISNPIQGGSSSLVGEIVSLVGERDHTLDDQVVRQEVEFALESYFNTDPYALSMSNTNFRQRIGIARLVQARVMMSQVARSSGTTSGWTAGLVSMKSGDVSSNERLIGWLLKEAMLGLGLSTSRIAQMAELPIAGGLSRIVTADISRLLIEVE